VQCAKPAIDRVAQIAGQTVNNIADVAGPSAGWLTEQGDGLKAT
jgi:hypothetical protein